MTSVCVKHGTLYCKIAQCSSNCLFERQDKKALPYNADPYLCLRTPFETCPALRHPRTRHSPLQQNTSYEKIATSIHSFFVF